MTKIPRKLAAIMPPNTAVPTARTVAAPAPVVMMSGTSPAMKAKEVIITARKRSLAASMAAVDDVLSLPPLLHGEFDDQDGVLGRERDEHHDADLGVDVVVEARDLERRHRAKQADRHREQGRHRNGPALVEPHEKEVCEEHGQRQDEAGLPRCCLFLQRRARPLVGIALGKSRLGDLLHGGNGVARGKARTPDRR